MLPDAIPTLFAPVAACFAWAVVVVGLALCLTGSRPTPRV